ncbi:Alpha/Beta hydrolase protein [Cercophora newfieldiana]|uniref:Alpha/Beta hydrolase protein n=1 Tax=Cercophora newfieldiana TaxID=92897 RepID=A0AA40CP47_9PEZI|nr:Alpha/Beta hydrolase protein [Cercophora newfieldiana]
MSEAVGNSRFGLHILRDAPSNARRPIDVVAVHGLNGHPFETWTQAGKGDSTLWLKDLLHTKLPGVRVMTFGYDATVLGNTSEQNVRANAGSLLAELRNRREGDDGGDEDSDEGDHVGLNGRPIVFVAHSLGGIVVKQALTLANKKKAYKDIADSTKGIIFFGTPHKGADAATWARQISDIVQVALHRPPASFLETLERHSPDLLKISEDFRVFAPRYAITSFYEQHATKVLGTVVVGKMSAVLHLPNEEATMMGGDHREMCRFGKADPRFDQVWRAIRRSSRGVC